MNHYRVRIGGTNIKATTAADDHRSAARQVIQEHAHTDPARVAVEELSGQWRAYRFTRSGQLRELARYA